jgi:endoglycosylceramidase
MAPAAAASALCPLGWGGGGGDPPKRALATVSAMPAEPASRARRRAAGWLFLLALLAAACGGSAEVGGQSPLPTVQQYSPPSSLPSRPPQAGSDFPGSVQGALQSRGGPFLTDRYGRAVFLHGVNAVYKHPPYQLYVDPGAPWNLSATDASLMAKLGFNVVRLGILWAGLEPGNLGPNDPRVCSPGPPGDPGQYDQSMVDSYLARVSQTVNLLGHYHIYSLLDMHQDVYNTEFRGEGAPNWAVCTGLVPPIPIPGRWSNNYASPALDVAMDHFWYNDVVGDLQGEYDRVWGAVAHYFRNNPWVVGYDPFNEPFSRTLAARGNHQLADVLECFYTGRARPGMSFDGHTPISCPPDDPAFGVVPTIERNDPNHLVFVEPDIYARRGVANYLGAMDFPRLVFNFHDYCSYRSGVTGDPTDLKACLSQELETITQRSLERPQMATRFQPGGPAWFLSEFGASADPELIEELANFSDQFLLGWCYWAWRYYDDPTGSSHEALVLPGDRLSPTAPALSRTYPQAVAGIPKVVSFRTEDGSFFLGYSPKPSIKAPTVVFVASDLHYRNGYCSRVVGGAIASKPGQRHLLVRNLAGAPEVSVSVSAGPCRQ